MDSAILEKVRDYRFQGLAAVGVIVVALAAIPASATLAMVVAILGVVVVLLVSILDHRHRAAEMAARRRSIGEVALHFPAGTDARDVRLSEVSCVVRNLRGSRPERRFTTQAHAGPGGWTCTLPLTQGDEAVEIGFADGLGQNWRVDQFVPELKIPQVDVIPVQAADPTRDREP